MKFNIKEYKTNKLRKYLKKNFVLIYFKPNNVKSKKNFQSIYLNSFNITNSIIKKILLYSVFKNYNIIIEGSTIFIYFKNYQEINKIKIKNYFQLFDSTYLLAIKLNNKLYKPTQIKKITTFSHYDNIKLFKQILKLITENLTIKL